MKSSPGAVIARQTLVLRVEIYGDLPDALRVASGIVNSPELGAAIVAAIADTSALVRVHMEAPRDR